MLLPDPLVGNGGALEGFVVQVGDDGMGNLYPMSFNCGVRVVDPSRLADPIELEQI